MEHPPTVSVAAIVRRKEARQTFPATSQYLAKNYDIVLVRGDLELQAGPGSAEQSAKTGLFLPHGNIKFGEDCGVSIVNGMYNWTKGLFASAFPNRPNPPGLRARQTVFLGAFCREIWMPRTGNRGTSPAHQVQTQLLYLITTTKEESAFMDVIPPAAHVPVFGCYGSVLKAAYSEEAKPFDETSCCMLSAVDKYLREQHMIPNAMEMLYQSSTRQRLRAFACNPHFKAMPSMKPDEEEQEDDSAEIKKEKMNRHAKMFPTDMVDIHVVNPLLVNDVEYCDKVDRTVVNPHFGRGEPDYSKICVPGQPYWHVDVEEIASSSTARVELVMDDDANQETEIASLDWVDEYPLHCSAIDGNVSAIMEHLQQGKDANQVDPDTWTPLHYACWNGQTAAAKALIDSGGADPMKINENGDTALHLAASNGRAEIAHILMNTIGVEKAKRNSDGRTALELCEERQQHEWEVVLMLLRGEHTDLGQAYRAAAAAAMASADATDVIKGQRYDEIAQQAIKRQRVNLIDGTHKIITLEKGFNSTTVDMLEALFSTLGISQAAKSLFTIWVVSPSLKIPLTANQKPLEFVRNWPELLIRFHVNSNDNPVPELPSVHMMREPSCTKEEEEEIRDPIAVNLLYEESCQRVVSGEYIASEQDLINLGGIAMQVNHGDHNDIIHRQGFITGSLQLFLPLLLLSRAGKNKLRHMEQMILQTHRQVTARNLPDDMAEHLLYLNYCRRWPVYGATFFPGMLLTNDKNQSRQAVHVALNVDGIHLIRVDDQVFLGSFFFNAVKWSCDVSQRHLIVQKSGVTKSGASKTVSAETMELRVEIQEVALVETLLQKLHEKFKLVTSGKGMGLPDVWARQPAVPSGDISKWRRRFEQENASRGQITQSMGSTPNQSSNFLARDICMKYAQSSPGQHLQAWFNLCQELGLFLGAEDLQAAQVMLGQHVVDFKRLVMWWSQSARSWLFLLDDDALRRRQRAVKMFQTLEVTPGMLSSDQLAALLELMSATSGIHLPYRGNVERCLSELESFCLASGHLQLNTFIDWLAMTNCLLDKPWSTVPPPIAP